jgi:hypothetical protein
LFVVSDGGTNGRTVSTAHCYRKLFFEIYKLNPIVSLGINTINTTTTVQNK